MKFYICVQANLATGGPELLHQLAVALRSKGINCVMHYVDRVHNDPVAPQYKNFNIPYVDFFEDEKESVVICPETLSAFFNNFVHCTKVLWWLSYDHYFLYGKMTAINFLNKILFKYFDNQNYISGEIPCGKNLYHYTQSVYASDKLLNRHSLNSSMLTDFLSDDILNFKVDFSVKKNIVAYNPKKGMKFTRKLISLAPEIEFVPIINMSRDEVVSLLSLSKVYIDFGYHPGRDRIPREAAVLFNCVLVNKRGSANYFDDVPIPDSYKFSSSDFRSIIDKIHDCFDNYDSLIHDFSYYRDVISNQKSIFDNEVNYLIGKLSNEI